jgi:Spy/CpxP family protein refolding chaperone
MKKMIFIALSVALLSIPPGVWAGGMGGMGGGHMGGGMMGGDQRGDRQSWNSNRYQRNDDAQRQYDEDTHRLRRDIDEKQDALDRELDRSDPDLSKVKSLHRELSELRDDLDHEQRRFEGSRQGDARGYDGNRYPSAW